MDAMNPSDNHRDERDQVNGRQMLQRLLAVRRRVEERAPGASDWLHLSHLAMQRGWQKEPPAIRETLTDQLRVLEQLAQSLLG